VITVFSGVQNVQVIDFSQTKNMSLTGITFLAVRCFQICCFSFEPAFAVIKEEKVLTCVNPVHSFLNEMLNGLTVLDYGLKHFISFDNGCPIVIL
jgi:hypothetical protein